MIWTARLRGLWWFGPLEGQNSTNGEFSPVQRHLRDEKSPPVDFSPQAAETFRPEPRTPGPGAAWNGGRL